MFDLTSDHVPTLIVLLALLVALRSRAARRLRPNAVAVWLAAGAAAIACKVAERFGSDLLPAWALILLQTLGQGGFYLNLLLIDRALTSLEKRGSGGGGGRSGPPPVPEGGNGVGFLTSGGDRPRSPSEGVSGPIVADLETDPYARERVLTLDELDEQHSEAAKARRAADLADWLTSHRGNSIGKMLTREQRERLAHTYRDQRWDR